MKIEEHMIADKDIVGTTGAGEDVLGIRTHGGLFAYFLRKKSGGYKTLAMAPHKAIAAWMAEQTSDSRIQWNALEKSEPKTDEQIYDMARVAMFTKSEEKFKPSDRYLAFHNTSGAMHLMTASEVEEIAKTEGREWLVRNAALSEPCTLACFWKKP